MLVAAVNFSWLQSSQPLVESQEVYEMTGVLPFPLRCLGATGCAGIGHYQPKTNKGLWQIIPIGRHCRRTEVRAERLPGTVYLLHPSQTNSIVVIKKKSTKERLWSLLEMDAGREGMNVRTRHVCG